MSLPACRTTVQQNKWIKRLRREAAANPKKAAFLGLMLVVALIFWAPLLRGWIGGGEASQQAVVENPAATTGNVSPAAPEGAAPAKSSQENTIACTWEDWDKWIKQDPRTNAATDLFGQRNPFHAVRQVVAEKPVKEVKKSRIEPIRVTATPTSLGMQVSSTVVGPSPRLAVINGKVYREGETIVVSKDGRKVAFTLAEVHARQVILSSQDERFELNIAERKRSGRLEVSSGQ